jgi:hypothetical protein
MCFRNKAYTLDSTIRVQPMVYGYNCFNELYVCLSSTNISYLLWTSDQFSENYKNWHWFVLLLLFMREYPRYGLKPLIYAHLTHYDCSVTVAARSKAWTLFAHSNTGIVGSNLARGMDVCVHLFCVCVVLCVGSGLATVWSPVRGVLRTVYK